MKIGIVTDTNLLKIKKEDLYKNKSVLTNVDFFYEYIEDLKKTKKGNKQIIYYMPKFIIDELIFQKKEAFEEQYNAFKESFEKINYAICGDLPSNNIESNLDKEVQESRHKYKLIDLEYREEILKKLIDDALNKRAPFDKSKEGYKTDAGFKDALIWNSILYSKEIDLCDKFYFMSCDKVFYDSKEQLESEFKKFHPNIDVKIVWNEPNGSERQKSLQEVIDDNGLIETDTIKLYNESLLITYISQLRYNYGKNVVCDDETSYTLKTIMFNTFNENDFNIIKVKQLELDKFEVEIEFYTNKYEIVEQIEEHKKIPVIGNINLVFIKEKNCFQFVSYIITNIEFYQNPFSKFLLNFSNALQNSYITYQFNSNVALLVEKLKEALVPMPEITQSFSKSSVNNLLSEIIKKSLKVQKDSNTSNLEEKDDVSAKIETE